jgi:hypothetical protein
VGTGCLWALSWGPWVLLFHVLFFWL